jgi:hypothetical protein
MTMRGRGGPDKRSGQLRRQHRQLRRRVCIPLPRTARIYRTYICICMHVCIYVHTYSCMHACMHVCMTVCIYMYKDTYVCTHTYIRIYRYIRVYTYIHTHLPHLPFPETNLRSFPSAKPCGCAFFFLLYARLVCDTWQWCLQKARAQAVSAPPKMAPRWHPRALHLRFAYVSIRQHPSAYANIRKMAALRNPALCTCGSHTSAYVSIRQHT